MDWAEVGKDAGLLIGGLVSGVAAVVATIKRPRDAPTKKDEIMAAVAILKEVKEENDRNNKEILKHNLGVLEELRSMRQTFSDAVDQVKSDSERSVKSIDRLCGEVLKVTDRVTEMIIRRSGD